MQTYLIKKAKCASSQVAHNARAYPCFCRIKRVRVFLVPPPSLEWDASPSQGYPQHYFIGTYVWG